MDKFNTNKNTNVINNNNNKYSHICGHYENLVKLKCNDTNKESQYCIQIIELLHNCYKFKKNKESNM